MSKSSINKFTPIYDQLFKDVYAFTENALELLKAILSKAELSILDLVKIRLEKESFTKGLMADLLYTIPLKAYPHIRIPLLILFEHKSTYSSKVLIQVLGYMYEIIKKYIKVEGKTTIPPLLAVLFSHGDRQIKGPLSLQNLLPKEWLDLQSQEEDLKGPFSSLSKDMLNYKMRVYDVHDPKIYKSWYNLNSRIALHLFKDKNLLTSQDEKVLENELVYLFEGLRDVANQDIILSAVQYHLSRKNPKIDLKFFNRCLKLASDQDSKLVKVEGGKMGEYIPMMERGLLEGLAKGQEKGIQIGQKKGIQIGQEKGIQIGREKGIQIGQKKGIQIGQEKGIQIGREKGIQIGRQEEKQDIILNMLKNKIDISTIMKITKVTEDKILQIQKKLQVSDSNS